MFAVVWLVVLVFVASSIPCWAELFWVATFFIPPLILFPILGGC